MDGSGADPGESGTGSRGLESRASCGDSSTAVRVCQMVGPAVNQVRRNGHTLGSISPMLGLTPSQSRDSVDSRPALPALPVRVRARGGEGAMTATHERAQGIAEAINPHLRVESTRISFADCGGVVSCRNLARAHRVPVPEPLLLDETGEVLGVPGVVSRSIEGRQIADPKDPEKWAEDLARPLAVRPRII